MKINKNYLESIINDGVLPKTAWTSKYFNNELCYMIKNETYCKVFWMHFWYNYLLPKYKAQKMVINVKNQDLTLPVIINQNLHFINAPKIIQNIDYYSNPRIESTPFKLKITLDLVLVLTLLAFFIIIMATFKFGKNSIYSTLV